MGLLLGFTHWSSRKNVVPDSVSLQNNVCFNGIHHESIVLPETSFKSKMKRPHLRVLSVKRANCLTAVDMHHITCSVRSLHLPNKESHCGMLLYPLATSVRLVKHGSALPSQNGSKFRLCSVLVGLN